MNGGDRIPVILCGCEASEGAIEAVADGLRREGHPLDVLLGVDINGGVLTDALDQLRGRALFVLCEADELDRSHTRRLEGLFSARKGPMHGILVARLVGRRPSAVVTQILGVASHTGFDSRPADDDEGRHMRDVVVPSSVAAVPGATVSEWRGNASSRRESARLVEEPQGISGEALGLPDDTRVFDPDDEATERRRAKVREPSSLISTDPVDTEELRANPPSGDGIPMEVAEDYPMVGAAGPGGARPWDHGGRVGVDRVAPAARRDPRAEADSRPLPSASTPIELEHDPNPSIARSESEPGGVSGIRVLLLMLAVAGMLGIVVMASLHTTMPRGASPDEGAVAERGVPKRGSVDDGEIDGAASAGAEGQTPPPSPSSSTGSRGSGTSLAASEVGSTSGEASGTSGGAAETEEDETTSGSAGSGTESPIPSVPTPTMVPPPPDAPPSAAKLDDAIEAALAEGRMQVMDELLVLPAAKTTMTWDEAAARCRRRKVDGLRGWRLPSKGQLLKLRRAKLLAGGSYWSRSMVGGDEAYAFDAKSGRMNVWLVMEPNARALCVRSWPR